MGVEGEYKFRLGNGVIYLYKNVLEGNCLGLLVTLFFRFVYLIVV